MQPAPTLTGAVYAGGNQATITGSASGTGTIRVDLYGNNAATSEGRQWLGAIFVLSGAFSQTINFNPALPFITATASPGGTNTSTFSNAVRITGIPAPSLRTDTPDVGPTAGNTPVTLSGSNFLSGATVSFGGVASPSVTFVNATTLTAVSPPHAAGTVNIVVTNPDGQSSNGVPFGYVASVPNPQPTAPTAPGGPPSPRPPSEPSVPTAPGGPPNPLPRPR